MKPIIPASSTVLHPVSPRWRRPAWAFVPIWRRATRISARLLLATACLTAPLATAAATVWSGPRIVFTKANGADPTQAANQDRLTSNVWLTRASSQGLYNIAREAFFTHFVSPADTEWASGTTANYASLKYTDWETWAKSVGGPPATVGVNAVLHLKTDDIYVDIKFLSWFAQPASGGAFSYERSTPGPGPANGACGSAHGGTFTTAPTANLCTAGTPTAVSGGGPWSWSCIGSNGGSTAACSASLKTWTVTPSAGAGGAISPAAAVTVNHGSTTTFSITPNSGNTASVGGTCGGFLSGTTYTTNVITADCTVSATFTPISINGVCGSANGVSSPVFPSSGLCSSGTATGSAGDNTQWTWTCAGNAGGTNASCSAPRLTAPVCTVSASTNTINLGGSAVLTATCNPAATSYAWTPAAGLVAGPANTATVTPTAAGNYQYSVTGSNAAGPGNTANVFVTVAPAAFTAQSDCLFNWAQSNYPGLFAPAVAISNTLATYYYRYYSQTGAYLAASSADSHVYYLGPLSNNLVLDLGALPGWLTIAGCQ